MPKILAIDDKRDNLISLSALLKAMIPGCDVITATSGPEGIEKAKTDLPDTILLDIRMPGMDGYDVCNRLKSIENIKHIPVIMISAIQTESKDLVRGLNTGADAYLAKPVDEQVLIAQVKTALRMKTAEEALRGQKNLLEELVRKRTVELVNTNVQLKREIDERKKTEKTLKESEKRYRTLLETTSEGCWLLNPEVKTIEVNAAFCEMLGYSQNEMLGKQPFDFVDDENRKIFIEQTSKISDTAHRSYEIVLKKKNGEDLHTYFNATTIRDESGEVLGSFAFITDITQKKRAEEETKSNEARFRELFTNINSGVAVYEAKDNGNDFIFKDFNQAGERIENIKKENIIGKSVLEVFPGVREFGLFDVFKRVWETGKPEDHPISLYKDERITGWRENFVYKLPSGEIVAVYEDVTERKRAEKLLKESQKTLLTVLDSIDATIYVADMDTYEIMFMNKHMKDSFGADFTGKACWKVFRNESGPCDHCPKDKLLDEEGNPTGVQVWHDQNPITGLWHINYDRAIKWFNGRYAQLQVATDITEYKKLEEQLRQTQKMEAIGTLAGGVAHDFNNILTIITGYAEIALMGVIKDESLRLKIEGIKAAGEKAAVLTRQLLAFSRKQVIKPEVLDLNEVINETEKMLKRMIGEDIEIQTILEPELWKVHMDSGQVDQIVINMAVNARDAMPDGGKLIVETANVNLDENYFSKHGIEKEQPGSYVMIAVSDTGIGMDKETREHIFEPFYTTKGIGKGTGLGLSTVYGIAKQNNGFIWVYSEPGQGTTFKVYLPKVKGDAKSGKNERPSVVDLNGSETVLIVEDDDKLRKLARTILKKRGYKALEAENGEDALRVSKGYAGSIDLLLTDVVMPKISGKETAERLQPLYPQMKVIYMSGYTDNAIVHHGVLTPGLNFLEKPFSPEGLARKVRDVLDK